MRKNDAVIGPHSRVKLHFSLSLVNGDQIDSTQNSGKDAPAAELKIGDGKLLPGFEQCLLGLQAGETGYFELNEEEAFGKVNPNNINFIHRDKFPGDIPLEPGLMVSFAATGGELPGIVEAIHGDQIKVNFNHPLAGKRIVFEVRIVEVQQGLIAMT